VRRPKAEGYYAERHSDCIRAISERHAQIVLTDVHFASQKVLGEALDAGWTLYDIQQAMNVLRLNWH